MSFFSSIIKRLLAKDFPAHLTGRRAEDLAAKELKKRGYRIIDRNIVLQCGEIDILANDGENLVIVEVKSLKNPKEGFTPSVHLNKAKRKRLVRLAAELTRKKKLRGLPVRFDLVSVIFSNGGASLEIFTRVFDVQGRLV